MAKTKRRLEWEAKRKKQIQEDQEFEDWFMNCTEEEFYAKPFGPKEKKLKEV